MECQHNTLIGELIRGKELAKQLKNQIEICSSQETGDILAAKLVCSYEKALSMLNQGCFLKETKPIIEYPTSFGSPRSEICDQDSYQKDIFKKRKTMPSWTEQVKVSSESGLGGPADDGYSWRKYGQKEILGATHPRSYYRCTHRHVQGCLATKHVQRLNEDASIFEVTYRGRHTCRQSSHSVIASPSLNKQDLRKENQIACQQQHEKEKPKPPQEMLGNHGAGVKVKTEDLDTTREDAIFPLFAFSSTPTECEKVENQFFSESMIEFETNFMGSFSPPFISPATSESNYLPISPLCITNFGQGRDNVQTSESELTEILSAPTSVANSPIGDWDLPLDKDDFQLNFCFENPEVFSQCFQS